MAKREGVSTEEFEKALTDGLHVVTAAEQAAYFSQGGLKTVIERTGRVLTQAKTLRQPKPSEAYLSDRFVTTAP